MHEVRDSTALLPLFRRLPYHLVPLAAAAGVARGRFFADDEARPRLAILWDEAHGLYVAGDLDGGDGIPSQEAASLLDTDVLPETKPPGFILFAEETTSADALAELLGGRRLIADERAIFRLKSGDETAVGRGSDDEIVPVDAALFRRRDLIGRETLDEWLDECWPSLDVFAERGFGVAALDGNSVVGWCMAEYVAGGACGIGIETAPQHRGRGVATSLGRAFVAAANARGLTAYWDSWARNRPSVAVAEKLGFVTKTTYRVHWVPSGA